MPRQHRPILRTNVVMLPAGGGNIGDQAMFEAFLAHVEGPVVAMMGDADAYVIPAADAARVRVLPVPLLSGGTYRGRLPEVRAFLAELNGACTFTVVGADIMDGIYNRSEAVTRSELMNLAARRGVPSRMLGFSWSLTPDPVARDALRRAARRARLFARDPATLQRLARARIPAELTADLAFTAASARVPESLSADLATSGAPGRTVIVNMSGLIHRQLDLTGEFAALIDEIVTEGGRVILLPHTIRGGDDDLTVCRATLARVRSTSGVIIVDRLLRPAEVRWLAGQADAVITGRMHLAIHALVAATPVVVLRTRDKVEGLLEMFRLDAFGLVPRHGVTEDARVLLDRALHDPTVRERIEQNLPRIRELALRQFSA